MTRKESVCVVSLIARTPAEGLLPATIAGLTLA